MPTLNDSSVSCAELASLREESSQHLLWHTFACGMLLLNGHLKKASTRQIKGFQVERDGQTLNAGQIVIMSQHRDTAAMLIS